MKLYRLYLGLMDRSNMPVDPSILGAIKRYIAGIAGGFSMSHSEGAWTFAGQIYYEDSVRFDIVLADDLTMETIAAVVKGMADQTSVLVVYADGHASFIDNSKGNETIPWVNTQLGEYFNV